MSENNYGALMMKTALSADVHLDELTLPGIYPVEPGNPTSPDPNGGILTIHSGLDKRRSFSSDAIIYASSTLNSTTLLWSQWACPLSRLNPGKDIAEDGNIKTFLSNMLLSSPDYGANLIAGARRYFRVTDYPGGVPDSKLSRKSDGTLNIAINTNNTSAIKAALMDAQAVNGVVFFPSPENGLAYYFDETISPAVTVANLWRGASLLGEGKTATKLIFGGGDKPAIHVKGTSGWPTNIFLQGISLYSANDFVGEGWKLQGITGIRLSDFAAYRFGDGGLSFSNGSASGIFTEFNIIEDGWLENCKTNNKFRKDGGDGSFHGITLRNIISNNLPGQSGLDIGEGCVIYNADWNQVTFFGATGVMWIKNNGTRTGFETLYFEGDGEIQNNVWWNTAGFWRIQNSTGKINDTSAVPFTNESYITPTAPVDPNFAAAGFNKILSTSPPAVGQSFRDIVRVQGENSEGIGIIGYGSGDFEKQGLAILSQADGAGFNGISMRYLLHLNGLKSFRPNFSMSYAGGVAQLSINSNGRASGVMGRRTSGTISANASEQTITTSGLYFPESAFPALVTFLFKSNDNGVIYSALYAGASSPVGITNMKLVATLIDTDINASFNPPDSITVNTAGNMSFSFKTAVPLTFTITILGIGAY